MVANVNLASNREFDYDHGLTIIGRGWAKYHDLLKEVMECIL